MKRSPMPRRSKPMKRTPLTVKAEKAPAKRLAKAGNLPKVKRKTPKQAKDHATILHSRYTRRLGYCQACGRTQNLQCAHIIGRSYAATRTDEENAFCLDAGCHMRFTLHPDEWMDYVESTIGRAEYDRLKRKALDGVGQRMDWHAELDRWITLCESVGIPTSLRPPKED